MMKRTFIRGLFSVVAALFVASATAAGKVEVTGDTSHGTVTSTTEGVLVTVTVTPAEGYYIRKSDITATKAFMPVAAAPRRSSVPVADELTLVGADPEDLSQARTYTITLPGEEYDVLLDVRYFNRNAITESMVSLSETVFVYNGKEQRPTVFVRGLTENKDYTLTYSNLNSQETGEYTVTVKGRSAWSGTITRTYKIFAGGKVEVNNSITGGTIATAIDGLTVTLTVTPADGYYIRKQDIQVAKTFMPMAANSRRAISVADLLTLEGEDPSDLSLPRTYTAQLPGWEYNAYADAVFTMRTNLTDDMVRLSSTEFPYNGTDQKPQVTVRGLTEGVDYLLSFNGSSWSDVGTYSLTVTGRSTWKGTVSKTYSITKVPAVVSQKPEALSLIYTKETQTLVKAGDAIGGTMLYSLDGASFTSSLPSATAANTYTVYYKVQGDANHTDSQPQSISATIGKKDVVISGIVAQDKVYDGTTAVTLVYDGVVYGGLVEGDMLTLMAEGAFSDADAGADKPVAISHLTLGGASIANYQLAAEGQQTLTTATISKAASSVVKVPVALSLIYTGLAQTLAEPGEGAGGVMQYSLSADGPFAEAVPTGTAAGSYTLYYMVQGDGNHLNTAVASISVTIAGKVVDTPVIDLDEPTFVYDGQPKRPSVTVKDGETVIPATEYEVVYESNVNVGDAKVVITDVEGGNYIVSGQATFSIVKADAMITKEPVALSLIYTGAPQTLIVAGESLDGSLLYSIDGISYHTGLPTGTHAGEYTVYYKVQGDANHSDTQPQSVSATIGKKDIVISGIVAQDKVYDGTTAVTLVYDSVIYGGIVEGDVLTVTAEGAFSDADAGADKAVAISHLTLGGASIANYQLATEGQQTLATAIISKAASSVTKVPVALSLTYTGFAQTLAEPGEGAGGVMQYSLSADGPFAEAVPTGTAAGSYTLYYMVQGDGNHLNTAVASISVTIAGKVVDMPVIDFDEPTLVYDGQPKCPSVTVKDGETVIPATEYEVVYESNVNVGDAKVVITDVKGGNYVVSGEAVFSIVKADPVVTTTPKALELDYNGEPQVLISAGEAIGGVLVYSLDGESYDTVLPTAIEPALYTVYYKVIGDDNHLDSEVSTASAVIRPQQLLYASGNEANADIVVDDDGNVNVVINELPEGFFDGTAELPTTLVDENSTEYGVTEVASEAFEDMPSDIIVVLPEGVSTTEGVTNVVNGDGTCETMDLTDITDFNLPIDVEAENVVYVREVQEETFTVCLPYDCDVPDNATAYVLKDTDEDGLSFEEHDGQLEAYQPYVLTVQQPVETRRRSGGNDSSQTVTLSAMNVVLSCSADEGTIQKNNYILCGSVRSMTHAEGFEKKVYIMQPDYSWRMTASSDPVMAQEQYLAPFQAYLLYTGSEEPQEVSSSFVESVTGVKLTNIHRKVEQDGWYSLEGYKLAARPTHKGIYLRHGKKIVLK